MDNVIERPQLTAKDFFLHLGSVVTLYVSAGSLIALLVAIINFVFAEEFRTFSYYGDYMTQSFRIPIATLLVIFPAYLILMWLLARDEVMNPAKRRLGFRNWLTYITLFLAAGLAIGDLIVFLNNFLTGELTVRFILKVAAVFVIGGLVFAYYIWDLRRRREGRLAVRRTFFWLAVVVVAAFIV